MRKCGKCSKSGHNARTCGKEKTSIDSSSLDGRRSLKEKGRELIEQQREKKQRLEIDGMKAKRGLWLVNPERKRVAGYVSSVKRTGDIVWRDLSDHEELFMVSEPWKFKESGYKFYQDFPLTDSDWTFLKRGVWENVL